MSLHLVTGGSGYFGSVLVAQLHARGERVRVLDLNDATDRPAAVELHRGDIRDPVTVRRACQGVEVVHHNVAQVPLAKDKHQFWSVNHEGTRILLDACAAAGVRKVVHMSSSAVFGVPERNPVDDAVAPRPREEYGRAKLAAEELVRAYVARGLDVTIVRPRTILGHGRLGIFQILFEWIRQGRNIPVLGRGDNVYQFVHADDLARACLLAADRPGPDVFNVGTDRFGTMRETLEGVIRHAGTSSRVVSVPMYPAVKGMELTGRLGLSPLGPYHWLMYGRSMYFDLARTKASLGWSPRFSNVEMFCDSYDWYLAHRQEVVGGHTAASHHRSGVKQGLLAVFSRALSLLPA